MSRYLFLDARTGSLHSVSNGYDKYSAKNAAKEIVAADPDLRLLVVHVESEVYAEREVRTEDNDFVVDFAFAPAKPSEPEAPPLPPLDVTQAAPAAPATTDEEIPI